MEYLKLNQKFICKKNNEYRNVSVTISEELLADDEETLYFLHYYGFEEEKL